MNIKQYALKNAEMFDFVTFSMAHHDDDTDVRQPSGSVRRPEIMVWVKTRNSKNATIKSN